MSHYKKINNDKVQTELLARGIASIYNINYESALTLAHEFMFELNMNTQAETISSCFSFDKKYRKDETDISEEEQIKEFWVSSINAHKLDNL